MRLIDAQDLINQFAWHELNNLSKNEIYKIINEAPTERQQGEWLTHRVAFYLTCPFCGCNLRALKSEVFEGDYDYNFCPNCGADMKGGAE